MDTTALNLLVGVLMLHQTALQARFPILLMNKDQSMAYAMDQSH